MTKLGLMFLLACVLGVCSGQPYKFSAGGGQPFEQLAKLFSSGQYADADVAQDRSYAKPLSFGYLSQPMAQVQLAREPQQQAVPYASFQQRMAGEKYFKNPVENSDDDTEEVPYKVIKDYGPYEHREYPSANFACVKAEVDTDNDVLAGLEDVNPLVLMSSKRYRKSPSSIMFMELFKYISGVNQENEEVKMTKPVSTLHSIKQKQFGGEVELQEMCFYVPASHQNNPPKPLEKSPVYIKNRPTMKVYARRFGGYILTADAWREERDLLEMLLIGKPHHDREYYTNGYNSPFVMRNRRNEVWIQDLQAGPPVVAAVQAETDEEEEHDMEHNMDHDSKHKMSGKHQKKETHHKKEVAEAEEEEIEPQPEVHVPFETANQKAAAAQ